MHSNTNSDSANISFSYSWASAVSAYTNWFTIAKVRRSFPLACQYVLMNWLHDWFLKLVAFSWQIRALFLRFPNIFYCDFATQFFALCGYIPSLSKRVINFARALCFWTSLHKVLSVSLVSTTVFFLMQTSVKYCHVMKTGRWSRTTVRHNYYTSVRQV